MSRRLRLDVNWLPSPAEGEAFGPEITTWAELKIVIDEHCVTGNHPADSSGDPRPFVIGGMSGLAEWIVDAWLPIQFEAHTPFPKVSTLEGRRRTFPSTRDALQGWKSFISADAPVSGAMLGPWQQRHTLGEGRSPLALPSLVLVPEGSWIGIALDHVPAALEPSIRFAPPNAPDGWPAPPLWIPRRDVTEALGTFVDSVLHRAEEFDASRQWANWLGTRWAKVREDVHVPEVVRRWKYGSLVMERWGDLLARLGRKLDAFEGLLADTPILLDDPSLELLVSMLEREGGSSPRIPEVLQDINWSLPHHLEGYRLAQAFRKLHGLNAEPIGEASFEEILGEMGVELRPTPASGLFRSAVWTLGESAVLAVAEDDAVLSQAAPRRFAVAAAIGRLLVDGRDGKIRGAAHSRQARWRPTQVANAFAAELLFPIQAIRTERPLREQFAAYGISNTAGSQHVRNRVPALEI